MKSVRLHAIRNLQIHDEPVPGIREGEVDPGKGCGNLWLGSALVFRSWIGDAQLKRPLMLGHEFAGVTEAGERVAVDPAIPCGCCEWCEKGHPNLCANL